MTLDDSRIAVIGAGVMGEAMVKGLLHKQLVTASQITASDPHVERGEELTQSYGIRSTISNVEAAQSAEILVLAIKPQVMDRVLKELRGCADHCSLVLTIAAGVKIRRVAADLLNARVARAMPNTPGQIGHGITVWTASPDVPPPQRAQAQAILGALGEEMMVDDERFLDMATALSGTGPAYVFMFMEALIDVGVHLGFSRRDAEHLVLETMRGSLEYAADSGLHPAELRNQVTSPGGTSAAAIYQLEKGAFRTVLADAVWAAYRRASELGQDEDGINEK
jgi:pyrroline-5-carboxylate reductase